MNSNIFSLLVKKEWVDNRKQVILGILVVWGTFILMGGFLGSLPAGAGTTLFLFIFFTGLAVSIGASLAFSNMKTKEGRINELMLPATTSQKFMVRWLAAVPLLLIVVTVGFFLGDLTRVMVERINDFPGETMMDWINDKVGSHNDEWRLLSTVVFCTLLSAQALYFLGSIIWPKLSFIKTLAALQVLQILLGFILVMCDVNRHNIYFDSLDAMVWTAWIFTAVFCGTIYWLAYVRFRRSQVTYKLF